MEGICQECVNFWQEINSPETLQEMCIFRSSHGRRKPVDGGVTWSHVCYALVNIFKDKKLCLRELEVLYDQDRE